MGLEKAGAAMLAVGAWAAKATKGGSLTSVLGIKR